MRPPPRSKAAIQLPPARRWWLLGAPGFECCAVKRRKCSAGNPRGIPPKRLPIVATSNWNGSGTGSIGKANQQRAEN